MPYWGNGAPLSLPSLWRLDGAFLSPPHKWLCSTYVVKSPSIFEFLTLVRSLTAPPRMFAMRACGTAVPAFMLKLFRVCIPAEPLSGAY